MSRFGKLAASLGGVLAPQTCPACGERGEADVLCDACRDSAVPLGEPACGVCRLPGRFPGEEPRCEACLAGRGFRSACAAALFDEPLKSWVARLKYRGERTLAPALGHLARGAFERFCDVAAYDLVVPVPLSPGRYRERGFNQSFLLASAIATPHGLPVVSMLRRIRETAPQVGLESGAREENVAGAFAVDPEHGEPIGLTVLLVDDVLTTGATVDACARVLMGAGAAAVDVVTLARTT